MIRALSSSLLIVLASGCTSEGAATPKRVDTPNQSKPAERNPPLASAPTPRPDDAERLRVTAEQAQALGLPPLVFSLKLGDSGLSGSGGHDGDYLTLSGPPGGVLMLRVYPATIGADLRALIGARHPDQAELIEERIELLGAGRPALTWVRGESHARSSSCAFIVGPPGVGVGGPALLFELSVSAKEAGCAASRSKLGPVLESLRFD